MLSARGLKVVLALCLFCAPLPAAYRRGSDRLKAGPDGGAAQGGARHEAVSVTVEGATLTGPFSLTQWRGGRLFLPLVSIGRALGDYVRVRADARQVEVRRQTGVLADFDAALGRVRENGAPVLVIQDDGDIVFTPQPEALMLPTEIVSALLDVAIQVDTAARVVRVARARATPVAVKATRQGPFELYEAEYHYNFDRYPTGFQQNLTLRSTGRLRDGRFTLLGNFGGAAINSLGSYRSGTFDFERPGGQRFIAGDFGTGSDLAFASAAIRGGWAQLPFGPARLTVFAGRMMGAPAEPLVDAAPAPELAPQPERHTDFSRPAYDTRIIGSYLTFGPPVQNPLRSGAPLFSIGAVSFDGPARRGRMLTGGVRSSAERYSFQADFGAGTFRGPQGGGVAADGVGVAASLSGSFNVNDDLSVQGRYDYAGRSFQTPQPGTLSLLNHKSLGVTWRPRSWLTATLTGSDSSRPDSPTQGGRVLTAAVSLAPRRYLSGLLLSHTRSSTPEVRGGSFTLLNGAKDFSRWRVFVNASRIKALGPAYASAQFGAALRFRESDSLQLSQTFGSRGALGGTADWWTPSFLTKRVRLGAGVGYSRAAGSPVKTYERVSAGLGLPFRQEAQISLGLLQSGPQLSVSLRGPLFTRREARAEASGPVAELNRRGSVSGRVYQDLNLNGRFDPDADAPQSNVRVRVDGNLYATTDREGFYRIGDTLAGEHAVTLDLLSVRADLTILDKQSRAVTLRPGFDAAVDFRLVRTGRVTGAVWFDLDGDGRMDEGEPPLAGVRVVTGGGRDTLTDELGQYVIGDLSPGLHVVLVDAKTLPDNTAVRALAPDSPTGLPEQSQPSRGVSQVTVVAGAETGGVSFAVNTRPAEVKRF
jgi:hypothetical protein